MEFINMFFLFIGTGIAFWVACAVLFVAFSIAAAIESGRLCAFATAFLLAMVYMTPGGDARLAWTIANPLSIAMAVGAYVLVGAVWSVVKWWLYALRLGDSFREFKSDFLAARSVSDVAALTPDDAEEFREAARRRMKSLTKDQASYPLRVGEHKAVLLMWSAYWPVSVCVTILDEPVRRAFTWAYRRLNKVYESIAVNSSAEYRDLVDQKPGTDTKAS